MWAWLEAGVTKCDILPRMDPHDTMAATSFGLVWAQSILPYLVDRGTYPTHGYVFDNKLVCASDGDLIARHDCTTEGLSRIQLPYWVLSKEALSHSRDDLLHVWSIPLYLYNHILLEGQHRLVLLLHTRSCVELYRLCRRLHSSRVPENVAFSGQIRRDNQKLGDDCILQWKRAQTGWAWWLKLQQLASVIAFQYKWHDFWK